MPYPKLQPVYWIRRNMTANLDFALYDSDNNIISKETLDDKDSILAKIYDYQGEIIWEGVAIPIDIDTTKPEGQQRNIRITLIPDESILLGPGTYTVSIETRKDDDNTEFYLGEKLKVSEHSIMYLPKLIPTSHDFGDVSVGVPSSAQQFVVFNTTKTDIVVTDISITGADASDFTSNPSGTGSWTLTANGGTLDIEVVFTPSHLGAHTASLEVTYDSSTLTAALAGNGV